MKICFVGLGSIGKRHIKNFYQVLNERNISFTIDALRSKPNPLPDDIKTFVSKQYFKIDDLPGEYDVIFITNPTAYHSETIKALIPKTKHMFIEKPVFQIPAYDLEEWKFNFSGIYYVAAPMRYCPVIKYIKNNINPDDVYSVRAISSSFLPSWRKGSDYRNNYSAHKNMGGGVTLDLIHEIDYLTYLFGFPESGFNLQGHYSDLEIDSDDLSVYILKYNNKIIEVHLDYFGKKTVRNIELYCKDCVIKGDFISNRISYITDEKKEEISLPDEDDFINEMRYFMDLIEGTAKNTNDIYHANNVLKVAINYNKEV